MTCVACCAELPLSALSCLRCHRLTHAEQLADLTRRAKEAWRFGRFAEERELWTQALALLPANTVQHRSISSRIEEIDGMMPGAPHARHTGWKKASMGVGPALLLLLGKGKFLLLGLTKIGTLLSMAASIGVYWALYGWALAFGIVISIYIHEMGHVAMIRRYGFPASPPMFIPGLGAMIFLRRVNLPPIPDSRIGLAGPIWGLGATLVALGAFYLTGLRTWAVIAHFSAWVNLFNLIPVWQLDGSRGLRSLTRTQRAIVLAVAIAVWFATRDGILLIIAALCGYRTFTRDWQTEPDQKGLLQFVGLLLALSLVVWLTASRMGTA